MTMATAPSVYQAFRHCVRVHGDRAMLHIVADTARRYGQGSGVVTYREANDRVQHLIAAYHALGVYPGVRVALGLDNRPEFFYHWLALNALAASVAPLNPHWRPAELEYVLAHSEARFAVVLPDRVSTSWAAATPTATSQRHTAKDAGARSRLIARVSSRTARTHRHARRRHHTTACM